MHANERILVLHDGDRIGHAVVRQLEAAQVSLRELAEQVPADEVVAAALGCRAVIAIGDRFASDAAVLAAANMPGVRSLVLVVHTADDFTLLRKRGVPYTVLRLAPLLEELVDRLEPVVASGRLILDENGDAPLAFIAADDAAACAIAAVDQDDYCGRIVDVAAAGESTLSAAATAMAKARGQRLKVSEWPRWVITAMRALGRAPFRAPEAFIRKRPSHDASLLHPNPWHTVEEIASASPRNRVERRDEHAMGMH